MRRLGLREVSAEELLPYLEDAEAFAEAECTRLAALVGGGECSFAPSSMVQSAALQLAGSRCAFARGDLMTGSRLADASRANLMSARDECAREALAAPRQGAEAPWLLTSGDQRASGPTSSPADPQPELDAVPASNGASRR